MTGNTEEPEFIADAQTKFLLVSSTSVINHLLPGKNLNENLDASTEREERNLEDILQQLKGDPAKIDGSKLMILENILKNNKSTKELLDEESEKGDEAQETLPEDPKEKEGYGTNQLNEFDRLLENLE
jgi:Skp family chaperone for outer membrane proteins